MVATLNSLSEENHTARTDRAEDHATLQSITETLKTLQGQLADMLQQHHTQNLTLLRLEGKGTPQLGGTGLLRPPDAPSHTGAPVDLGDRAPRLYKIDFPLFDRASDPRPWLTRCNLFFLGQRTPESDKTWLASYHLTDVAALWYGHLETKLGQRPSWTEFQKLIANHFGPPTRANPFGELISTRRSGTVAEYSKRFLENLSRVRPIADDDEWDIFTNNLGEPMKTQVEMLKLATLDATMDLAISFEHLNTITSTAATPGRPSRPLRPMAAPTPALPDSSNPTHALVFKRLTPAEMDERRAKGLCFNCDEKFERGHRNDCSTFNPPTPKRSSLRISRKHKSHSWLLPEFPPATQCRSLFASGTVTWSPCLIQAALITSSTKSWPPSSGCLSPPIVVWESRSLMAIR